MDDMDGQEAFEILAEYIANAPEDIRRAWDIYDRTYNLLLAQAQSLVNLKEKED